MSNANSLSSSLQKNCQQLLSSENFLKNMPFGESKEASSLWPIFNVNGMGFQTGLWDRLRTEVVDQRFEITIIRELRHTMKTTPNQAYERHQGHLISPQPVYGGFIDLKFVPIRVNKLHKISERNYEIRETFCLWFLSQDRNFHSKVLWSDEKWWVEQPKRLDLGTLQPSS